MDLVNRNEFVVEQFTPSVAIGKLLGNFAVPLGLWAIALALAAYAILPGSLSGLKIHGPYLVLTSGLLLSLAFRRGRAFFVLLSFTFAYLAFVLFLQHEDAGLMSRTVYAALCVFVPLNIAIFALLRERGALNAPGLRRLALPLIDIDHFKAFNDTWGHDVGDQVLKLVAARLQRVGGGGTAYRYGREEFTILFPGRRAISVMQHLESLRKNIESYKLMLRESGRPHRPTPGRAMPIASGANKWISVTISIGVAERGGRLDAPEAVLTAADKALYRAKTDGRNRVSR